jgi:hypothetical protein
MHLVEVSCKSNQELGWGKLGKAGIGVKVQKIRLKLGERGLLAKYQIVGMFCVDKQPNGPEHDFCLVHTIIFNY